MRCYQSDCVSTSQNLFQPLYQWTLVATNPIEFPIKIMDNGQINEKFQLNIFLDVDLGFKPSSKNYF